MSEKTSTMKTELFNEFYNLSNKIDKYLCTFLPTISEDPMTVDIIKEKMMDIFFETENGKVSNSKLNFIKNNKSVAQMIMDDNDFGKTIEFYRDFNNIIVEFIDIFEPKFNGYVNELKLNSIEESKLFNFTYAFSTAVNANSGDILVLRSIVRTNVGEMNIISKRVPQDKLRKYYFPHTLELKNNIKIFTESDMLYGETNNIMRSYKRVLDFTYVDLVYYLNTIKYLLNNVK